VLGEKVGNGVLDEFLIATIFETLREAFDQSATLLDLA
jgi:hypothetical protein